MLWGHGILCQGQGAMGDILCDQVIIAAVFLSLQPENSYIGLDP